MTLNQVTTNTLCPSQIVRLGLPAKIPPRIARMIAFRTASLRDIDRLKEISVILHNMQITPATYAGRRGRPNVQIEGIKIVELLENVETDILGKPIKIESYGSRGARYLRHWRLVGPTSRMEFMGGYIEGNTLSLMFSSCEKLDLTQRVEDLQKYDVRFWNQERGLCEQCDELEKSHGTRYQCKVSAAHWDGSLPGEIRDQSSATGGWFSDEIMFIKRLIALIHQSSIE